MRCFLLALVCVSATSLAVDADALDLRERPVSKVINLLKDMSSALAKEAANDKDVTEKMNCWCEVNEKDKTEAVAEANRRIDQLVADIQKHTGKSAELSATIKQLEKELAENQEALAKATEVREKENQEFNQDEKDTVQALGAMKNAVLVLGKHNSFLQKGATTNAGSQKYTEAEMKNILQIAMGIQKQGMSFLQQPNANAGSYTPASGQIFGILNQMKEEFENNLSTMQQEEATAQKEFADLKAAKQTEIAAGKQQTKDKVQNLADTDQGLAQAKEDLDMTREALAADTEFLSDLKLRCQQFGHDTGLRAKTRSDEIAAISETITILTDDDAHDTMGRTMGFIQTNMEDKAIRNTAAEAIRSVGRKHHNLRLIALASTVQIDAFEKVKAAIDEMVVALEKEQKDEVVQRDWCIDEFQQNEKQTAVKQREITDLGSAIDMAKATIDSLTKDIEAEHAVIAETEIQSKKASETREAGNHEFQLATADQRATQAILKKALARLEVFYKEKKEALLQSEPGAAAPPPPAGHAEYKKSGGAGGVMMLIQNIIDEASTMEKDGIQAEADSQAGYESFIKDSNNAIADANKAIATKTDEKAQTEAAKVQAEGDRAQALTDAENLSNYKGELHASCDFLTKNFDLRQQARIEEMDGLAQAKATLSGANI